MILSTTLKPWIGINQKQTEKIKINGLYQFFTTHCLLTMISFLVILKYQVMSYTSHSHKKANVYQTLTRNKTIDDTAFIQNVPLSWSFYVYILKVATFCDEWLWKFFFFEVFYLVFLKRLHCIYGKVVAIISLSHLIKHYKNKLKFLLFSN